MRIVLLITVFLHLNFMYGQSHEEAVIAFQSHLNAEYSDPEKSPLTAKDLKNFKGHDFYPINKNLKVTARFERKENAVPFLMKTTTERLPTYEIYGVATFVFEDQTYRLNIYQSHRLRETEEYKNHLFLPFTDLTNGNETYGGGRFIDLEIPDGDAIIIDFNKAYNPYCAYNSKYSCPIPPKENELPIAIKAGVKI